MSSKTHINSAQKNRQDWAKTALGHQFADATLLDIACTHGSVSDRHGARNYERLEFLGDRVLGCVMAEWLYHEFSGAEGGLAQRFAELVSGRICAIVARAIDAPAHIIIDHHARCEGVADSDNVLGDMCEALIGALFLDGGLDCAQQFIRRAWAPHIADVATPPRHPKSALQEWAARHRLGVPVYEMVGRSGPHHAPQFRVRLSLKNHDPVEAESGSKSDAERRAARAMLDRLKP